MTEEQARELFFFVFVLGWTARFDNAGPEVLNSREALFWSRWRPMWEAQLGVKKPEPSDGGAQLRLLDDS